LASLAEERIGGIPGLGIAIGTIEDGVVKRLFSGAADAARALDSQTVFEIGSVTKTFTATLLAEMARRGEVALDNPIEKFLPKAASAPLYNGRHITLVDLATQSSGLPTLPTNMKSANAMDPSDYKPELLYAFLSDYKLTREPGSQYEYSNLGFGLLGLLLANRAATSYATLLSDRILRPLKMESTATGLTRAMDPHLAGGHDADGGHAPDWFFDALDGAGAIRSSLDDMLRYVSANMTPSGSLGEAMKAAQFPRREATPGERVGLAWQTDVKSGVVWHNGQTAGYHAFVGMSTDRKRGIVILHNAGEDIDDIGFHWLYPGRPLKRDYQALSLDPKLLGRYEGTYGLGPQHVPYLVTREGGRLFAQLGSQPRFRIYPYAPNRFFYRVVDAQIDFTVDGNGNPTGLTLHQNGRDVEATRAN